MKTNRFHRSSATALWAVLLLFFSMPAWTKSPMASPTVKVFEALPEEVNMPADLRTIDTSVLMSIDAKAFDSIVAAKKGLINDFFLPDGRSVAIRAQVLPSSRSVFAPDCSIRIIRENGESDFVPPPKVETMYGEIVDEPESFFHLSRIGQRFYGSLKTQGITLGITPTSESSMPTLAGLYQISGQSSSNFDSFECGATGTLSASGEDIFESISPDFADFTLRENDGLSDMDRAIRTNEGILLIVDCTHEYYLALDSDYGKAVEYLGALIAEVNSIYARDVRVGFALVQFTIHSESPDPFDTTSSQTALDTLRDYWENNNDSEPILFHLVHSSPINHWGGLAAIDGLCSSNYRNRTGVSDVHANYDYPTSSYTWDVNVLAHELGHNIGSPHTHCYSPPIDMCSNAASTGLECYSGPTSDSPGTIMSYCHAIGTNSVQLEFHPTVRALMREKLNDATCIMSNLPLNDSFSFGFPLYSDTTASNVGATVEDDEPQHAGVSSAGSSIWWRWTAPASGMVTIDTLGSDFDTVLAVYQGSSLASLSGVASNDDIDTSAEMYQSRVVFNASVESTYQIAVAGYDSEEGNVVLNIDYGSAGNLPLAPIITSVDAPGYGQALVSWSSDGDVNGYHLYYDEDADNPPYQPDQEGMPPSGDTVFTTSQIISGLTPGQVYHFAVTAFNSSGESDYSPAVSGTAGDNGGGGNQPDLVVESISHTPASPSPGEAVNFTVTVRNQGPSDSPGPFFNVGFWANRASAPQISDTPDADMDYEGILAAGASTTFSFSASMPAPGNYTAWAYVDRFQGSSEITESNENNNAGPAGGRSWTVESSGGGGDDAYEENDIWQDAAVLPMNIAVGGLKCLDDDWYLISTDPTEHVKIDISFSHALGNLNAQLYDTRSAVVGAEWGYNVSDSLSLDDNESLSYVNVTGCTGLYLRVYGEGGATNDYSITATTFSADDALEGLNDASCGTLPLLMPNNVYDDLICRDIDWYRVDVSGFNTLTVDLLHTYFSGDLDMMITHDTGDCAAFLQLIALGNRHHPNEPETLTVNVTGLDVVLIRVYGEQRQTNFYSLALTGQ